MHLSETVRCAVASVACYVMHQMLAMQYADQCRPSWLAALGVEPSGYCSLLKKGMTALQWSPVGVLWLADRR